MICLVARPAPNPPQKKWGELILETISLISSNRDSPPLTMNVKVPAMAPLAPPYYNLEWAQRRGVERLIVLQSRKRCLGFASLLVLRSPFFRSCRLLKHDVLRGA